MSTRTAVVFGAGKMACGLIGHVLARSGFSVQFVARRPEVVAAINQFGGFQLSIAGQPRPLVIRGCSALPIEDERRVTRAVANADLVFTAVGIDNLAHVTPAIGAGLFLRSKTRRDDPLNVIACENLPGTALCIEQVGGFSAAVTRRVMTGGDTRRGELHFSVDSEHGLIVDRTGLRADLPALDGLLVTDDFTAIVMRKFFTLNCAQAVAAVSSRARATSDFFIVPPEISRTAREIAEFFIQDWTVRQANNLNNNRRGTSASKQRQQKVC